MKTILHLKIALIIALLLPLSSNAQFTDYERDTKWNLGFNMGGVWQDGDILLDRPGFGYGFTLGKGIYEAPNRFWSVDLRMRYLKGRTFGQDIKLTDSSELADNSVFATNPSNYKNTLGFTYFNTETALHDFSLEAVVNFHGLREKTGVLLSVFGGIGITDYRTKTNLLDDRNLDKIYNYNLIDSATATKFDLRNLQDDSYESFAPFSEEKTVKFMPSLGIGLGYQISKQWSIGFEHRVTFALQDKFDGVERAGTQFLQWGDNDKYHYSSFFLRLNIFKGSDERTTSTKNCPPPYLKIADFPEVYEVNEDKLVIRARVSKIKSNNDVIFVVNDQVEQTYYNRSTDYAAGTATLKEGSNKIYFVASNSCGESIDSMIVIYNPDFCPKAVITFVQPYKDTVNSKNVRVEA
ncbi:MAG: outer membrane beta-barrel protein, partial [Flavobacteriales bacterium]